MQLRRRGKGEGGNEEGKGCITGVKEVQRVREREKEELGPSREEGK